MPNTSWGTAINGITLSEAALLESYWKSIPIDFIPYRKNISKLTDTILKDLETGKWILRIFYNKTVIGTKEFDSSHQAALYSMSWLAKLASIEKQVTEHTRKQYVECGMQYN